MHELIQAEAEALEFIDRKTKVSIKGFTIKRKRFIMKGVKSNKETNAMVDKIKVSYEQTRLFATVLYHVIEVLILEGVGGWLIYTGKDPVVIAVGVAMALWSLVKMVGLAFKAEGKFTGKRK